MSRSVKSNIKNKNWARRCIGKNLFAADRIRFDTSISNRYIDMNDTFETSLCHTNRAVVAVGGHGPHAHSLSTPVSSRVSIVTSRLLAGVVCGLASSCAMWSSSCNRRTTVWDAVLLFNPEFVICQNWIHDMYIYYEFNFDIVTNSGLNSKTVSHTTAVGDGHMLLLRLRSAPSLMYGDKRQFPPVAFAFGSSISLLDTMFIAAANCSAVRKLGQRRLDD